MIQNSFSFNLSKPSKGLAPSLGKSCLQICRVGLQASNPWGSENACNESCTCGKTWNLLSLLKIVHVCYPSCQSTGQRWLPGLQPVKKLRTSVQVDTHVDTLRMFSKKKSQLRKHYWWISITSLFPPASWNIPNLRQSNSQALCCWYRHQVPLDDHWRSLLPQWQFLCFFTSNDVSWDSAEELWHSCSQRSADEVSHPSTLKWPSIRGFVDKSLTEDNFKEEICPCWESELLDYMCNVYNMMCNWL